MILTATVTLPDEDASTGWGGDRSEVAASIRATLHELIGDDGGAYVPAVSVE